MSSHHVWMNWTLMWPRRLLLSEFSAILLCREVVVYSREVITWFFQPWTNLIGSIVSDRGPPCNTFQLASSERPGNCTTFFEVLCCHLLCHQNGMCCELLAIPDVVWVSRVGKNVNHHIVIPLKLTQVTKYHILELSMKIFHAA